MGQVQFALSDRRCKTLPSEQLHPRGSEYLTPGLGRELVISLRHRLPSITESTAMMTLGSGTRREFLRLGALGLGGLTLADLLRHDAHAGEGQRPKSVIYVVLGGGPSHIDMYDLKPDAPDEYRGPFRPIATRLTGVRICELMPLQAN